MASAVSAEQQLKHEGSLRYPLNATCASFCVALVSWRDSREVSLQAAGAQEPFERLSANSAAEAGGAAVPRDWSLAESDFLLFLTW